MPAGPPESTAATRCQRLKRALSAGLLRRSKQGRTRPSSRLSSPRSPRDGPLTRLVRHPPHELTSRHYRPIAGRHQAHPDAPIRQRPEQGSDAARRRTVSDRRRGPEPQQRWPYDRWPPIVSRPRRNRKGHGRALALGSTAIPPVRAARRHNVSFVSTATRIGRGALGTIISDVRAVWAPASGAGGNELATDCAIRIRVRRSSKIVTEWTSVLRDVDTRCR